MHYAKPLEFGDFLITPAWITFINHTLADEPGTEKSSSGLRHFDLWTQGR